MRFNLIFLFINVSGTILKSRIINGDRAESKKYPFMTGIFRNSFFQESYKTRHICGGTLINKNFILTAAHCLDEKEIFPLDVIVGAYDLNDIDNDNNEKRIIKNYKIHSNYFENTYYPDSSLGPYDIALLYFEKPITKISPIEILNKSSTVSEELLLLGWGRQSLPDEKEKFPSKLQKGILKVLNDKKCQGDIDTNVEICVGNTEEKINAASGDSGGPFVIKKNDKFYQSALVSRGSTFIDTATDVTKLKDWIYNSILDFEETDSASGLFKFLPISICVLFFF